MPAVAECFFLDVSQGTSNVILLGGGRALVIDCGPAGGSRSLLALLQRYVTSIEALVVSHNDADHAGGVFKLLSRYPRGIREFFRVQDRSVLEDKLVKLIKVELAAGNLLKQPGTFAIDDEPKLLWRDSVLGLELVCVSPTHWETTEAQLARDPNAASAVVVLKCGGRKIVFAGDSTVSQWRKLHNRIGTTHCDVLAVSHHAGQNWSNGANVNTELAWLYGTGLTCDTAIVSVGTVNAYEHPRREVIDALKSSGATIACTQITTGCCSSLEPLRPGVRKPSVYSYSSPKLDVTKSGRSRNVACAGTVIAEVSSTSVVIQGIAQHQAGVDRIKAAGASPFCR
jgi:hypothetical protein